MSVLRPAAVAGRFYPDDPVQLQAEVRRLLSLTKPATGEVPKAIIVPHAGYAFSGPIAAFAYSRLFPVREVIERVVLIGPAHYDPVIGIGVSSADEFETPMGRIPLDRNTIESLLAMRQVTLADNAHRPEHSLEVQLPFLQEVLAEFRLVPLLAGRSTPAEVGEVLESLWGGPETLLVISSDLSHYRDYATAQQCDRETASAICELQSESLRGEWACGYLGIGGMLQVAGKHGMRPQLLDLRNSGDTGGGKDRVVGYGAFAVG